jgi:hypothetical protein
MKINVLVDDMSFSDKNEIIFRALNESTDSSNEVSLSYLNLTNHIMDVNFAIVNMSEIYNMYGSLLVATSVDTAKILSKAAVNAKKVYFMWDLSIILKTFDLEETKLCLSKLSLLTRSTEHSRIIKDTFGLESKVVPIFNLGEIWNLHA